MKHAHFDCVSGVAGDMTLAALVSAGWPVAELEALPARLRLDGVRVQVSDVRRGPFAAKHVHVDCPEQQPHRHLHHIEAILDQADLPASVRDRAKQVFLKLAEAEGRGARQHGPEVHFHEVGAGGRDRGHHRRALLGLSQLDVGTVGASQLHHSAAARWIRSTAHPVPAPATAALLSPAGAVRAGGGLVTPTGAALLATLVRTWGDAPPFRLTAVGTGAGTREFPDHPNILRILLGDLEPAASGAHAGERRVAVLETAVDDENPQFVAAAVSDLLAQGALDAMVAPVTMKKGRSGMWLVVVCEPGDASRLAELVLTRTNSLGVRVREERRIELPRKILEVNTEFGAIQVKVAVLPGGNVRAVPEFESVLQAAKRSGVTVHVVSAAAMRVFEELPTTP
jgi:uncharacterized protein (TIGR00299 family) protein